MGPTEKLATFTSNLDLRALPHEVIENAHIRLLDTIAVALAGAPEECSLIATDVARSTGESGSSSLIGSKEKFPPGWTAFVNGVRAHALEFDDMTTSIVSHTSATVVPSTLALAEKLDITGKGFLEAYIAGFEVTTRIGRAMGFKLLEKGWHPNGVLAVIGSAAANTRLLGGDVPNIQAAMGIGASCSSGIRKNVGSMTKPFHMGHAAMDGILAAQLAVRDYTADINIMERDDSVQGERGHSYFSFPETFVGEGNYDISNIVRGLGTEYELGSDSTITRFHPGSSFPQAAIDEVVELITREDSDPNNIERIRVGITPMCREIASYKLPRSAFEARFSLEYAIALAAIERSVTIHHYRTDDWVNREDMREMMSKIESYVPEEFSAVTDKWSEKGPSPVSCIIEIFHKDGRVMKGRRDTTRGYPGAKASWDDVMEKFESCASIVLSAPQRRRAAELIRRVTELNHIRELTEALA